MSDTFKRTKMAVVSVSVLFFLLVIFYFSPVAMTGKLALPVGLLFATSLWLLPWQMMLAMLFSCVGDYFGSCGNFMAQMAAFALAHVFIICYFVSRFRMGTSRRKYGRLSRRYMVIATVVVLPILTFALADIIPSVPQGVMRYGVVVYAMLIAFMLWSALQQRSLLFAIGAGLFLASDMVLAWNKFVEPVSYSGYYILVPYYLAQWLLFIRSTKWCGRQMEKE